MRILFSPLLLFVITIPVLTNAQSNPSYAQEMSNTVMKLWGDSPQAHVKFTKWTYDQDVILQAIQGLWKATGDAKYFDYLQKSMGFFLDDSGNISTYEFDNLTLDNIAPGRDLLLLYNVTGKKKYYDAVQALRKQLNSKDLI